MFRKTFILFLTFMSLEAQSPHRLLTQKATMDNVLFLNPAKLRLMQPDEKLTFNFITSSLSLSSDSLEFIDELNSASSSTSKNQEISKLLKKNIGETLSFSAHNFSSVDQNKDDLSWSLGMAHTLDGYFITHTGFGSKGAMESFMEKYRVLIATASLKKENWDYGVNLKAMKKTRSSYNYSINEMIENDSLSDYFDNKNTQEENALAVDMGIVYAPSTINFNPNFSFSLLNIGNSSFKELGTLAQTSNIGISLTPYEELSLQIDYLDLFKNEDTQKFEDGFRVYLGKSFFNDNLTVSSGIVYNAWSFGLDYHYGIFKIGLHSYKVKEYNEKKQRRHELSLAVVW
ncbi:MAG: Unknown protein [uncultured Sulfurovum sp.]|uniref:Uncharacterized protein n=1 Tax=uncultured Sulfurovum sp. TaxID=269237 RepID=A0A6S6TSH5_9BACT|nr:MAG: Unknown protein [uncultured Sulfurovum sp.]